MVETKIKWNEGDGYITATYEGSGNGSASISSDVNEGIDREQSIKVETTNKSTSATLVVSQEGLREVFLSSDGNFVLADGGTFNVLKDEEGGGDNMFPATIVFSDKTENLSNLAIAQYFLNNYPDMVVNANGKYTPISEDVNITGTSHCDGKVIGVTIFNSNSMIFYTDNSYSAYWGLRVFFDETYFLRGGTVEYFFD